MKDNLNHLLRCVSFDCGDTAEARLRRQYRKNSCEVVVWSNWIKLTFGQNKLHQFAYCSAISSLSITWTQTGRFFILFDFVFSFTHSRLFAWVFGCLFALLLFFFLYSIHKMINWRHREVNQQVKLFTILGTFSMHSFGDFSQCSAFDYFSLCFSVGTFLISTNFSLFSTFSCLASSSFSVTQNGWNAAGSIMSFTSEMWEER